MTVLLYDYLELEERAARHLRVWKIWHVILYVLAAVFGVLNYIFLQNTLALVDDQCILYPRNLSFYMVEKDHNSSNVLNIKHITNTPLSNISISTTENGALVKNGTVETSTNSVDEKNGDISEKGTTTEKVKDTVKRSTDASDNTSRNTTNNEATRAIDNSTTERIEQKTETGKDSNTSIEKTVTNTKNNDIIVVVNNVNIVIENATHRLMLQTSRTTFGNPNDCQFAEFMPVLSAVFSIVWTTLFIMCPAGGRTRSGLQQPWRILTPAMLFAIVMVGLTGHSFSLTNGGLQSFCAGFSNFTNTTACSAVDRFLERAGNSSLGLGQAAGVTRGCSAGAWAAWACAAAVLLARCISAPDFVVKRKAVYVARDPLQKITPYLQKTPKSRKRSVPSSPKRRDNASPKSVHTATTELVTATVEPAQDSAPTSLMGTPLKYDDRNELLDLTHSPAELFSGSRKK